MSKSAQAYSPPCREDAFLIALFVTAGVLLRSLALTKQARAEKEDWHFAADQVMAFRSADHPLFHDVRFQPVFDYYFRGGIESGGVSQFDLGSRLSDFPQGDFELLLTPSRSKQVSELWKALDSSYDTEMLYGNRLVLLYRCRYKVGDL